eukprot:TRINITY_DN17912_c0_g1_i1.p1 TRINITY_DN17912_c0_g1~~TRINITY_DN17912_c0_g1_i1.p1  ORF type:complete len:287 (+),score=40.91 TRINITY_DN17912_c0_g1_i1:125-985(+)
MCIRDRYGDMPLNDMSSTTSVLLACALVGLAAGHGGMLIPMPRNSIDSELPAWSNGKHPRTGVIEPLPCDCTNGTSPCNSGQSCFWFSQGCSIGCDKCDNDGRRFPNYDHCGKADTVPESKRLNLPKYRTANRNATAGSEHDVWKFQPWRAPGVAPVVDSCGMAGGSPTPVFNGGEYNTTIYAKQGDLGSVVLKPRPTGVVWKAGGTASTAWYIAFNHGGGYRFRLCPAEQQLTEECFQANELDFVGDTHTLTLENGTAVSITNTCLLYTSPSPRDRTRSRMPSSA